MRWVCSALARPRATKQASAIAKRVWLHLLKGGKNLKCEKIEIKKNGNGKIR